MRDVFIEKLTQLVSKDKNIYLVTGDLGFGVFDNFRKLYPNNFINAGVAEQNMIGLATGMALEGKTVFAYSIANFSTLRCVEQIRNDACYHNVNVKIVSVGAGFSYGQLGISHHATEDISIMRSLPDITVCTPSGAWETEHATECIAKTQGVCYLRLDKSKGNDAPVNPHENFTIGKGRILADGSDCTIFTVGGILEEVEKAAETLTQQHNIHVRIITFPTLKPIDKEIIISAVCDTHNIITVEEHTIDGGLGSIVAEVLCDTNIFPKKMLRIGLDSCFSSVVGTQTYLREIYNMDAQAITKRICNFLQK